MSDFDEDKTPLTLLNILAWARNKFPDAFGALPKVGEVTFEDIDDFKFDRSIRRSLIRSKHKKLLLVGAYSPGDEVEDEEALVYAHIHADDGFISFFWTKQLGSGNNELYNVQSNGHIAFSEPFSGVGNDTGHAKVTQRLEVLGRIRAIVSYYFLAAGHLKELIRYKRFTRVFTNDFKEGCYWIRNGGERPNMAVSAHVSTVHDAARDDIATSASVLRSADRESKPLSLKRRRSNANVGTQQKPTPKRQALTSVSPNVVRNSPTGVNEDETTRLRIQMTKVITENVELQQQLATQGYKYRGCLVDLDGKDDEIADLQAQLKDLRDGMKIIQEILGEHKF